MLSQKYMDKISGFGRGKHGYILLNQLLIFCIIVIGVMLMIFFQFNLEHKCYTKCKIICMEGCSDYNPNYG